MDDVLIWSLSTLFFLQDNCDYFELVISRTVSAVTDSCCESSIAEEIVFSLCFLIHWVDNSQYNYYLVEFRTLLFASLYFPISGIILLWSLQYRLQVSSTIV